MGRGGGGAKVTLGLASRERGAVPIGGGAAGARSLQQDPQAWRSGFDAGAAGKLYTACPHRAGSTEAWSWFSGFTEGQAKRDGYDYAIPSA